MRASKTLPPLESLRVFQEVARQNGFRKAGEALLISQSAVSHHIRKLEETLGRPLFRRHAKSISLTEEGEVLLEATRAGFDLIAGAATRIRQQDRSAPLRVSLLPSFAANWLLPRIERFRTLHPDIAVQLDPTLDLADLGQGEADLAIRYGSRPQAGESRLLFVEALCPAVSPDFAAMTSIRTPFDVLAHPLLDSRGSRDWRIWFEAQGLDPAEGRFVQLKDYNLVLEAAASGLGIGMARTRLIGGQIVAGRVQPIFDHVVSTEDAAHWLIAPNASKMHPSAEVFVQWLMSEAEDIAEVRNCILPGTS